MKKKFLLGIIPALLALSSCAGLGPKEDVKEDDLFIEDTLAHEEIFGESKIELQDYKSPLKRPPMGISTPIYGVQYQDSEEVGKIHMRFIAAIWLDDPSHTVKWTRTMYKGHDNGDQSGHVFKEELDVGCSKAYTSLANGSEKPLTIADINEQYGDEYNEYNYFVVYTMLNIPEETYSDYSIRANIIINDLPFYQGIAATVGGNANAVFDMSLTGHFISGKFGDSRASYAPEYDDEKGETKGDNNAVYYNVTLEEGDTFALVYYDEVNNVFLLNGTARDGDIGYYFSNDQKTMTTRYAGTYNIYLNGSDMIYSSPTTKLTRPIYVDVSERTWWGEASSRKTVLYAFNGSKPATFITMNRVGETNRYVTPTAIDPTEYTQFIVLDFNDDGNPITSLPDGRVENQSKDSAAINGKNKEDCIKIWDQDEGGDRKWWVSWVVRS